MAQSSVITENYQGMSLLADNSEPSFGVSAGDFSRFFYREMFDRFVGGALRQSTSSTGGSLNSQLFDARAAFKIKTANIAMHLEKVVRDRLFSQLDSLLDVDEWNDQDKVPTVESFDTFLKLRFILPMKKRPSIGSNYNGDLIAAWKDGERFLSIECGVGGKLRWALIGGPDADSAAGRTTLNRLHAVLAPYAPWEWGFADQLSPTR